MDFTFDVLIASYDRPEVLKTCLESIESNKRNELKNILVLTQGEDIETIKLVRSFSNKLPVKLITSETKLPPGASRNLLVKNSNAEYLQFLDDDAYLSNDYYTYFFDFINNQNFDVLGGTDQSPHNGNLKQKVLGKVLGSRFVMGPTSKRHSSKNKVELHAGEVDLTLCNLWIKKEVFTQGNNFFNESIMRCEENIFLEKLKQSDYRMLYVPELYVHHKRRDHLIDQGKIQFKSGYYRGLAFHIDKNTFKPFFLFPMLTGFLLTFFPYLPEQLQIGLILLHSFFAVITSLNIMVELKSLESFFLSWAIIIIVHVFFSIGIFFGSVKGKFINGKL
jgi:GT2 family glycosyltransferase